MWRLREGEAGMTYCHDCGHVMPGPNKLPRCTVCRSVFIGYTPNPLLKRP